MTREEFKNSCPLYPSFPNYTQEMYEGNKPAYKGSKMLDGGISEEYSCKYGGGEVYKDFLLNANFSVDKKTTIYIVGDSLGVVEQRYSGKPDVYEFTNDRRMRIPDGLINDKHRHELESDKIEKILNKKFDSHFWVLVQNRAKELYYSSKEG